MNPQQHSQNPNQPPQPQQPTQAPPRPPVQATDHFGGPHPDVHTIAPKPTNAPQPTPPAQSTPQPPATPQAPAPTPQPQSPKPHKRRGRGVLKFIAIIVLIGLLVAGGWYAYRAITTVTLETYEGDGYTIAVPSGYAEESFGTYVSFTPENQDATTDLGSWESTVTIVKSEISEEYSDQITTSLRTLSTGDQGERAIVSSIGFDAATSDYEYRDTQVDGYDAIQTTARILRGSEEVGSVHRLIVFTPTAYYTIHVDAMSSHDDLARTASRIINSFTVTE